MRCCVGSAMTIVEEPIIYRLDRLDNMLRHLEEIRGCNVVMRSTSPKSSCASSGTQTSDGHASSTDLSPKSLEKKSRPIEHLIIETEVKGTLIERLELVEDRVLKLEEELESDRKLAEKRKHNKGLKQLFKLCAKGGEVKTRSRNDH